MMRRLPVERLVFLDESGLNAAMTRTHAWGRRGQEFVECTPMNWGKNLTLLGAMRLTWRILLSTMFEATNNNNFVSWGVTKLLPRLKRGDIVVLDNLAAHKHPRVKFWCRRAGSGCCTCRRTRTTSTPSSPAGRFRSSTYPSELPAPPAISSALLAAHGTV
ncbi:MAG: transposase [Archangiaceae bacterium]|nr:transposase [Archangiaceae bacterium]